MNDQNTIAVTVAGLGILVRSYERHRRRNNHDEADIARVAGWDRSIVSLLSGIAARHQNQPVVGAANPRGYCPECGGYSGSRCADMAGAIATCEAWIACVDVIRAGLDDRGVAELAEIFPIAEGAPTA